MVRLANRVAVIAQGRIRRVGTIYEVFADLGLLAPAVYVLAALGTITVLQRIVHVRSELKKLEAPAA